MTDNDYTPGATIEYIPESNAPMPPKKNEALATLVQSRMDALGLSQPGLARAINKTNAYAWQLANGMTTLSAEDTIAALAAALEVSVDEIYHAAGVIPHDIQRMILTLPPRGLAALRDHLERENGL